MKYLLCLFFATQCLSANLDGFTKPLTEDDSEACYGAEKVLASAQPIYYRPLRQKCLVRAPAEGITRTYEVIACVKLSSSSSICDGFSSIDTTQNTVCFVKSPASTICRGFNVQVMDGAYVGVTNRDDLTEAYTASQKKQ